ncbi:MAG: peptidylprolyl isomerase [Steroidobacteraceae bacterium]
MPWSKLTALNLAAWLLVIAGSALGADAPAAAPKAASTMADILASAPASAWRALADENTLYMELPAGRVIIELEPALAPHTVANIEAMARLHYYDGLAVLRLQDNYVAQWGDPDGTRALPAELKALAPEFAVPQGTALFTPLADRDGYAPQAGFVDSFPAARDPVAGLAWLTHCYGAVGVGRDTDPTTGNGSELYAVIGNAPRHLDRNVTIVGSVRQGIELLSSLPRGTAELGFYATAAERTTIKSVRLASELPAASRVRLEVLRTDTPTFAALVDSRRNRHDDWFVRPAGYIELCNVPLPVRQINALH